MKDRSPIAVLVTPLARAWRAVAGLAEDLSHASHMGGRWREDSLEENPYAGTEPRRDTDRELAEQRRPH